MQSIYDPLLRSFNFTHASLKSFRVSPKSLWARSATCILLKVSRRMCCSSLLEAKWKCAELPTRRPSSSKKMTSQLANFTEILPIDTEKLGHFVYHSPDRSFQGDWELELTPRGSDAANLSRAAEKILTSNIPVAFPTETVYGLGADATRSAAVRGIFKAKQRPSDNPLIVHVSSLTQIYDLFNPLKSPGSPIPSIYAPLIQKFWPGPLTIIMQLPKPSPFAPEVTASLDTVGVRMPSSLLALALIHLSNRPIAAPSANTSSRPSPTTAAHVLQDLSGRIEIILDGGPCNVGLESTVVDGLCNPPLILRPGAVSLGMIRGCEGWGDVRLGYADGVEDPTPRAPGMKYRHYSPQARVVLVQGELDLETVQRFMSSGKSCGIVCTKKVGRHCSSVQEETHQYTRIQ